MNTGCPETLQNEADCARSISEHPLLVNLGTLCDMMVVCRNSLETPWRIRHTNPKIENQIFLEFHFLPPKYC